MRYHCIHIKTEFAEEWQKEVFDQTLCDYGVDTIDGNDYYIQSDVWEANSSIIHQHLSMIEGATLLSIEPCPDKNWNAAWEAEHPVQELPLGVKIIPHCAFGAGHHETTSMMIDELINHSSDIINHKSVLDHGTGTGVLAIFANKLGAKNVVAIDIDDKSVENARENAALNDVDIDVRLGGNLSAFDFRLSTFDLILANIHRNILSENMVSYASLLAPDGELWLSGFYESDCPTLISAAESQGLTYLATHANGDWRMLLFRK